MSATVVLEFMSGPRDGETVTLEPSGVPLAITIGRTVPAGGLSMPWDPDASRTHARLVQRDGPWWLEDTGSRNGTFVGEFAAATRITAPVRLVPGQIFRCGLTRLRIHPEAGAAAEGEASNYMQR